MIDKIKFINDVIDDGLIEVYYWDLKVIKIDNENKCFVVYKDYTWLTEEEKPFDENIEHIINLMYNKCLGYFELNRHVYVTIKKDN